MTQYPILNNIQMLLSEGFTHEELCLWCYDYFQPVYDKLTPHSTKKEIINRLINHVQQMEQLDTLLNLAEQDKPTQYYEHYPYYVTNLCGSHGAMQEQEKLGQVTTTISNARNTVVGNITGRNLIVGNRNIQIGENYGQVILGAENSATTTNAFQQALDKLRQRVMTNAFGTLQENALKQVDNFEKAISANKPDLAMMEYVQRWFSDNLPALFEAMTNIIFHSVVRQKVKASGSDLVTEFRFRFGQMV